MNHEVFWTLIDNARKDGRGMQEGMCEALAEALTAMNANEVAGFDRVFRELQAAAYRWDLWGAAHVVDGGCSDDGFEHFRNWLIGMGRRTYDAAMAEPDSLASAPWLLVEDGVHEFESLAYVAGTCTRRRRVGRRCRTGCGWLRRRRGMSSTSRMWRRCGGGTRG